jgi:hypothetical protein
VEHVEGVGLSGYSPQILAEGDKCKNRADSPDRFDAVISRRVEQCKNGVQLDPLESEEKQAEVEQQQAGVEGPEVEESDVEQWSREEKKEGKRKRVEPEALLADKADRRAEERKRFKAGKMSKAEEAEIGRRSRGYAEYERTR